MKYFYSAAQNGFYTDDIQYPNPPDDLIEIPEEYWMELLTSQTNGKIITSDKNGYPVAIDPPIPGKDELKKSELAVLSYEYQEDIKTLNIAWLAAAVSDGSGEGVKKDAVISEIEIRKAKYTSDRAEIISRYA